MTEHVDQMPAQAQSFEEKTAPRPSAGNNRAFRVMRDIIASFIWLYVIVKLFIFDLDVFIIQTYMPSAKWIVDYKFFFIISLLGLLAFFLNRRQILKWSAYVLFFPIIYLFWGLALILFKTKSWVFGFFLARSIFSFFARIKYNLITISLYTMSCLIIWVQQNKLFVFIGAFILCFSIVLTYVRRIASVFQEDKILIAYKKLFSSTNNFVRNNALEDSAILSLPPGTLTEKQIETRKTKLEISVIANRLSLFFAYKLRAYQTSKVSCIADIGAIVGSIISVITAFCFINLAISKIDGTQFSPSTASLFTYYYYSFNMFVFSSINELAATGIVSQVASMIEKFCALILGLVFVSILFNLKSQRQSDELASVIAGIEAEGASMENFIRREFRLENIDDAIAELERLQGGLLKIILWLTNAIK